MSYYLAKSSVDFHFICLSIICTIVLSTFLAFIYFTSQLHIRYLISCSFHPILHIGMLMLLCSLALSDFVYMHFGAFTIFSSNVMSLIQNLFLLAIGVVVQLTHTTFHQHSVIQIPHQFAKSEIFCVFIFS